MKISVFGLGYVGCVTAACLAKLGHEVIGVDIIKRKVDKINEGKSLIKEKSLDDLIEKSVKKGKLKATTDAKKAVLSSDISLVCVGTPPQKNGDLDLTALKRACKDIGIAIREKDYHIIVIRSTMFPGSFEMLKKILEKFSEKKYGKDFDIAVNPEFLREGNAIKDFFNPPFIVVGSENKNTCKKIFEFYKLIKTKKFIVEPGVAQMIKYASNSFHALKITFANEIASVCKKIGIDSKKLMKLFCADNQLNISLYYLKPGFAYGGSCLPKDVAALKNKASKLKLNVPLLESISKSNLQHIERAVNLIKKLKTKKVGILGITFKANTDDIRGNPILYIINKLVSQGYNIKIYDPNIRTDNLNGIRKSYRKEVYDLVTRENLKEKVNGVSKLFCSFPELLKQSLIITSSRDKKIEEFAKKLTDKHTIIDLQNILEKKELKAKYVSLC